MPYVNGVWEEDDSSEGDSSEQDMPEQTADGEALKEETAQEAPSPDIGEYIRRARLGSIGAGSLSGYEHLPESVPPTAQVPAQSLYAPGAKMQEYKHQIESEPLHSDYHPSKWRSVLSTIAGIGSGVAFGPNAGKQVQESIRDSPYQRQLGDYKQKLTQAGTEAQLEAGGNQAARQYYLDLAKVSHENAQSEAERERRTAEAARGRRYDWMTSPQAHQYKLEETAAAHPGGTGTLWSVTTLDGKKQVATAAPGGAFKVGDTLIPAEQVDPDKTKKLGVADPKTNVTNPFELWHQQNPNSPAEDFLKLNPRAQGEYAAYAADYKAAKPGASEREILRAFSADKETAPKAPIVMVPGPNGVVPTQSRLGVPLPEGTTTAGGMSTESVQANKRIVDEQKTIADNKKAYQTANQFAKLETGPGDVGLVMQFMGAVKPDSIGKMRFNKGEQDFIISTRDSLGDLDALLQKVSGGAKLVPQQRKQMLDAMKVMANPQSVGAEKVSFGGYDFPNQAAADAFKAHMAVK